MPWTPEELAAAYDGFQSGAAPSVSYSPEELSAAFDTYQKEAPTDWGNEIAGVANKALSGITNTLGFLSDVNPFRPGFLPNLKFDTGTRLQNTLKENDLMTNQEPQTEGGKLIGKAAEYLPAGLMGPGSLARGIAQTGVSALGGYLGEMAGGDTGEAIGAIAAPVGLSKVGSVANTLSGKFADALERSSIGATKGMLKQSARKGLINTPDGPQSKLGKAISETFDEGVYKGKYDPQDIRAALLDQATAKEDELQNVLGKVSSQTGASAPVFSNAEKFVNDLPLKEQGPWREKLQELKALYGNTGFSVDDWQLEKRKLYKTTNYESPKADKFDKAIAKDIKQHLEGAADVQGQGAAVRDLNRQLGNYGEILKKVVPGGIGGDEAENLGNSLLNLQRTSGGVGVDILSGMATGRPLSGIASGLGKLSLTTRRANRGAAGLFRQLEPLGVLEGASSSAGISPLADALSGGGETPTPSPSPLAQAFSEPQEAQMPTKLNPLVSAMIQQESAGNPDAVSPKGAQGLMQLMPATGKELAKKRGVAYDPFDPEQNVMLGTDYIQSLQSRYGDDRLALIAYNWGMGNLDKLIKRLGTNDFELLFSHLPTETKNYVTKIMRNYKKTSSQVEV